MPVGEPEPATPVGECREREPALRVVLDAALPGKPDEVRECVLPVVVSEARPGRAELVVEDAGDELLDVDSVEDEPPI